MITRLSLERFKSFQQAELLVDDFTVLVGTNASGKSNLRDALRFLHGIGRGYNLPEIIGGVYRDGIEIWSGIRGGPRSLAFNGATDFSLSVTMRVRHEQTDKDVRYTIRIAPGQDDQTPAILSESLDVDEENGAVFTTAPGTQRPPHQPVLPQWITQEQTPLAGRQIAQSCLTLLRQMRFLDLSPDVMRHPSVPGQTTLSDRGENLSAVLHHLCQNPQHKATLMSWLENLTPMDAANLDFHVDATGKVLLKLIEHDGRETLAFNASDGTLRFLALLAALLSHDTRQCYFFEEIEQGIHPTRLYLLLELMQRQAARKTCQVITTTHSPQVLLMVRPPYLDALSLTYRLPANPDTRIIRILDLPDAQRLIESQDIGRLHETGWFEDAADFVNSTEVSE